MPNSPIYYRLLLRCVFSSSSTSSRLSSSTTIHLILYYYYTPVTFYRLGRLIIVAARNFFIIGSTLKDAMLLNSERSDECIGFTMFSFSGSKVNLVGALGRSFFEIPNSFQKHREKLKKN
ncbi:Uncharacterized protein FWK35_00010172 [Aphis craccivora]|uniref:Uncharacterized protein n=1 Tax=Aphis craccivora TaxID=307492 RepID=A0A6G0YU82_APHCR|nr:Uncharacterized protein FWK35_00010172 [Aphis craccivora]